MNIEDKIRDALKKVIDPELGVSIVDLGLIYDVRYEAGEAEIDMTLTSPGCPLAPVIDREVREALKGVVEVEKLKVFSSIEHIKYCSLFMRSKNNLKKNQPPSTDRKARKD